ncbi:MAG: hypothetical protein IJ011_01860 [Clostridia bacterium]|nr:hypothetical protein [Clostridia bacterium]
MKKKILQIICIALCLYTVITCLGACGMLNSDDKESESVTNGGNGDVVDDDDEVETDENGYVVDSIDRTLNGRKIIILMDTSSQSDIMPDEATSGKNVIQDKAYLRRLALETELGCTFEIQTAPGEYDNMNDFIVVAEKAGYNNVDIICSFSLVPSMLQQKGLLSNLKNLQYPELDKPWWPESVKQWEHDGALYYIANNSSNRVVRAQEVVFANVGMIRDLGLEALDQKVIDYQWTIDLMIQYAKYVNTDTSLPESERVYGLVSDQFGRMDQFYYGSGLSMMSRNADGEIVLNVFDESAKSKTTSLVSKLGDIASTPSFFIDNNNKLKIMKANRTMFMAGYMNMIFELEDGSTYMPLPTPMYDTDQERYYTTPHNSYDVWSVPHTASNKEDSALVIEAIASSDYREMAPFFYEDKLKMRYSESALGVEIFDLIRTSTNIDFGRITASSMGIMEGAFRQCFYSGGTVYNNVYESQLKEHETAYPTNLALILMTFSKYKNQ